MSLSENQLQLHEHSWYGWQMLPGYEGRWNVPYFSPIYIRSVNAMKTGRGILRVDFVNVLYAQGVQGFEIDIQIIKHTSRYLVAGILGNNDRCAVISPIEFDWIRQFCPDLWSGNPPQLFGSAAEASASEYLQAVFGTGSWRSSE